MNRVCSSAPQLADVVPYDPKYLPADALLSANENPNDVTPQLREQIGREVARVAFNRYPDPLANELRDLIAEANGIPRDWVLVGNGGDELLFDTALAWGGPGRAFLNLPPTFSVYANNARITGTPIVTVERTPGDFRIPEDEVLNLVRSPESNIAFTIVTSPNNPTGTCESPEFLLRLLDATDALVMVDEAYYEFAGKTMLPHLAEHENLVILRTFSKAFSLAGVRVGYIMAHPSVIREYIKVRQPYSVDAVSQAVARVVYRNREAFRPGVQQIVAERDRLAAELARLSDVQVHPSDANWVLFKMPNAGEAWQYLYDRGILVRDFSTSPMLEGHLRVSVGTPEQNDAFLHALRSFIGRDHG